MPLLTRRSTLDLLARHGLRPRKGLGQNFLIDANTIRKIVSLAEVGPGSLVLEVGPGLGALTIALLEAGAEVIAIEQDRALAPALAETLAGHEDRVRLVWADAMTADVGGLLDERPATMVANLPYNIATPLMLDLLEGHPEISRYLVMVQREVGQRFVASPGDEGYGAVSVKLAYLARRKMVSRISRKVFLPEPAVESVLVGFERLDVPPVPVAKDALFALVEAGFAQRRKTLRNALRGAGLDASVIEPAMEAAGIAAGARAEELDLFAFASLAQRLEVPA